MKIKTKKLFRFFIWILFLPLIFSEIYAGHNYKDYTTKARNHIKLLNELYEKYPIQDKNKRIKTIKKLRKIWDEMISDHKQGNSKQRNYILLQMRGNYVQLRNMLKVVCIKMSRYSSDILIDYTERFKESKLSSKQKDIYENSFRVAKYEKYRARIAFIRKQFNYSARLYNRSVIILANTYRKLNWFVPSTYRKVQLNLKYKPRIAKSTQSVKSTTR